MINGITPKQYNDIDEKIDAIYRLVDSHNSPAMDPARLVAHTRDHLMRLKGYIEPIPVITISQ